MRARFPAIDTARIAAHIEAAYGIDQVRALSETFSAATPETVLAILDDAAKFSELYLGPLNDTADAEGCCIESGRVRTASGHRAAWDAFVANGWPTLDGLVAHGGQGLPLAIAASVQEIFDRSCPAFGMLPVPQRAAARLIAAYGSSELQAEWLPRLIAGDWGATICISEAEAGSDVGRIRTRAESNDDGTWAIVGEKCWISFGDHDLTSRIGHCLLARTSQPALRGSGLSLFLVPDSTVNSAGLSTRNAIIVRRIENKMGLHASPTCTLGFEGAKGYLIGVEGRGLAQLFVMITNMRLSVGVQGLGIASATADLALSYAEARRQGGSGSVPVAIAEHPDVQVMLLSMTARVETLRGLILATANLAELAQHEKNLQARADATALTQWLLPIVKTAGAEAAFDTASDAIQVLGGAGYTREWPAEQAMRDARVLAIFEGTTGIQALDLLQRRLCRDDARGLKLFLAIARSTATSCSVSEAAGFTRCLELLEDAACQLRVLSATCGGERGATAFLHLATLAATGWSAARLSALKRIDRSSRLIAAAARFWLSDIADRAALLHAQSVAGAASLALFGDVRRKPG